MAIQSLGYDGTIDATAWALLEPHLGGRFDTVEGRDDFAVSINGAATLTVNVAAGPNGARGAGIWDRDTSAGSVTLDAVSTSGATRWDAIVLRRVWSSGAGTTTLTKVNGTAAANAPQVLPSSGLLSTPGTSYDHVLALVQVTNGLTIPTAVADRRVRATKLFTAKDLTSLPPPSTALWGMHAELDSGATYKVAADNSGAPAWVPVSGLVTEYTGTSAATAATGWSGLTQRGLKIGNMVTLDLRFRRTGATLAASPGVGNFTDNLVGTVPAGLAPESTMPVPIQYYGTTAFIQVTGMCELRPTGQLWLQNGIAGADLYARSGSTDVSLRLSTTFGRKVA